MVTTMATAVITAVTIVTAVMTAVMTAVLMVTATARFRPIAATTRRVSVTCPAVSLWVLPVVG